MIRNPNHPIPGSEFRIPRFPFFLPGNGECYLYGSKSQLKLTPLTMFRVEDKSLRDMMRSVDPDDRSHIFTRSS
jgi:hypothetical protein